MYIVSGFNQSGVLTHISDAENRESYLCPYCKGELIQKKGKVMRHHFAHKMDTCNESTFAAQKTQIPLVDTFDLLTARQSKFLSRRVRYSDENIFHFSGKQQAINELEVMGILSTTQKRSESLTTFIEAVNSTAPNLIDPASQLLNQKGSDLFDAFLALRLATGPIQNGAAEDTIASRISTTTKINRGYYLHEPQRIGTTCSLVELQSSLKYWINAHQRYLAAFHPELLPLFRLRLGFYRMQHLYLFEVDDCVKIGVTRGDVNTRLAQVMREHKAEHGRVLALAPHAGILEKLLHKYYKRLNIKKGSYREFFNSSITEALLANFAHYNRVQSKPISLWLKHDAIVSALNNGLGLRETARATGRSVNTVVKVRDSMRAHLFYV